MNNILKQRNFFVTKEFEITENSLKIKIRKPLAYAESEVPLENITPLITSLREPNSILSLFTGLIFVCAICAIVSFFFENGGSKVEDIMFYIIALSAFGFMLAITYKNTVAITLVTGHSVFFYAKSPDSIVVHDYIQQIIAAQKTYLLSRYAQDDPYLSDDQLAANLKWLWERNIINDAELLDLRYKLLGKNTPQKIVGFKFNASNN